MYLQEFRIRWRGLKILQKKNTEKKTDVLRFFSKSKSLGSSNPSIAPMYTSHTSLYLPIIYTAVTEDRVPVHVRFAEIKSKSAARVTK